MGDSLILDSAEDFKGEEQGIFYAAHFDWEGTMEVCLNDATVYESYQEAGLSEEDLLYVPNYINDSYAFMICDIMIKNVNAKPNGLYLGSDYNISTMSLYEKLDCVGSEIYYFTGTIEDANEKQGLNYSLDKGEQKTFQVGYFVHKALLDGGFYYVVGSTEKYVIEFEIDERE